MRIAFMKGVSLYCFRIFGILGFKTGGYKTDFKFFAPIYAKQNLKSIIFKFTKLGFFRRFFWILSTATSYANVGFYFDLKLKGLVLR